MIKLTATLLALVSSLQGLAQEPNAPQAKGPMPRPYGYAIERGDRPIEIDGSLIDWPELPALDLSDPRQLSGTAHGAWREPGDCSAFLFLLWDEENLYFAATVKDDWHRPLDGKTVSQVETPVADAIVLSFDSNRDTRALGPTPGREEDVEFWLSEESAQGVMLWDRLRGTARTLEAGEARAVVSHDKVLGITTYEARIPWSAILPPNRKPSPGLVFDLQAVVYDFDESTDPFPQTRIGWTFGCGPAINPALFGSVQLLSTKGLQDELPSFPEYRQLPMPREGRSYWLDFREQLAKHPPELHDGKKAPEEAGGVERFRLLQELDNSVDRFPRVDYVEFCQRIHRRMTREVAGIGQYGPPQLWEQQLFAVSKAAEETPPEGTARVFRLPQNGWLVRGPKVSFMINPAGANLEKFVWGAAGLVILTEPLDMTQRNDQLLLRMKAVKEDRRFLTHAAFHVPVLQMKDMVLVEPGQSYGTPDSLEIRTLGKKKPDGSVPYSLGYYLKMADGPSFLFVGPQTEPDEVPDLPVDALILSPRNVFGPRIAKETNPGVVILDEGFQCTSFPGAERLKLRTMHALQKALLPSPSVLLAPGEAWDVSRS